MLGLWPFDQCDATAMNNKKQADNYKDLGDVERKAGQSLDLGSIYSDIRTNLMRFASRYFKKPQEIEDIVQEAFVRVIEAQRQREISSPKAYLFRATRNLALKQLDKSDYRLTDTLGDLLPSLASQQTSTLEEQFESQQKFELFCRVVRQLPVKCQRVYILRRVYGFTQKEIAKHMEISPKTVESHLTKAIVRCTEAMDAEEKGALPDIDSGRKYHV